LQLNLVIEVFSGLKYTLLKVTLDFFFNILDLRWKFVEIPTGLLGGNLIKPVS